MTNEHYKDCLFNDKTYLAKFNVLRSRKHDITTERVTKVALSSNDDKRIIIPDDPEHRTLALGHWRAKHPDLYKTKIKTDEFGVQSDLKLNFFSFFFLLKKERMSSSENLKSARMVEIFNPDGTVTTHSSMYRAARSLGLKRGGTTGVYVYVARGGGRLVDIRIPVEVVNEDGTRSTYKDINEVARIYGISAMEVHTMISNGTARLGKPTGKVLTNRPREGRVFGNSNIKVYAMVAHGKARLVCRGKGKKEKKRRKKRKIRKKKERFYDAVECQEKGKEWESWLKPPKEFFKIISLMVRKR